MSLSNIFTPQSIAVVGASAQPNTVGNDVLKNLLASYQGQVFPINPKSSKILDIACFCSVLDLPIVPDLVIIIVPAKVVLVVLQQIADKGIKGVVIISAGFKEVGGDGVELEDKIKKICIANNISLIGPNCLGVINPWIDMNSSFASDIPPKGNIAFVSQSGAICTAVIDYASTLGLGFSKFVSVGNKALCSEVEMIKYLQQDDQTEVIAIYAEALTNANLIIETMKSVTKPVVILKSGRTAEGSGASSSHTGALASEDVLYDALFRQAGMIRANTIEELFEYMLVLSRYGNSQKLKFENKKSKNIVGNKLLFKYIDPLNFSKTSSILDLPKNPNTLNHTATIDQDQKKLQVAIITNAGGPGVLTTDFVIENGMELAKISQDSIARLKLVLPSTANFHNPFDLIGDAPAQRYQDALEILMQDQGVDAAIVILTPQTTTQIDETAHFISKAVNGCKKPVIVSFIGGNKVLSGVEILRRNKVVHIDFPENAARALSVLNNVKSTFKNQETDNPAEYKLKLEKQQSKLQAQAIFDLYKSKSQEYIPESDAKIIFESYNIPAVKSVFCKNIDEVNSLVIKTFGQPQADNGGNLEATSADNKKPKLILKIISSNIMHKSDVGGIMPNVSLEDAQQEFSKMMSVVQSNLPNANLEGVLFSEMVDLSLGVEFILGAKKDPSLGTAIMFGLGGTMVELLNDVVFGFGQLQRSDILQMVDQLKSKKIIQGYRGKDPLDLEAIIYVIEALSSLLLDFPSITDVDMNPILVGYNHTAIKVLDAKIVFDLPSTNN